MSSLLKMTTFDRENNSRFGFHVTKNYFTLLMLLYAYITQGAQEVQVEAEVLRKSLVKQHRQVLCDLASLRNRPMLSHMSTPTVYCISMCAYKEWKHFLR